MEEKSKSQSRIYKLKKIINSRTQFCQHDHSCISNMIKGFAEAFSKAFVAKLCLNAILLIISSKKIIKSDKKISLILSILINKTNIRLGLFMGLQTLLIKGIQCFLRTIRKTEDGWNAAISGCIAGGISFLTQKPHVQYLLRVYLFARAAECLYQIGIQKNFYQHRKRNYAIAFTMMTSVIVYGFFFEPDILPLDTLKMYENFSQQKFEDQIWHMCNVQQYRNRQMY